MTAIVLPDIDASALDELRKRLPDLREIELPSLPKMEQVGKTADETIDRLLGRSRGPSWPWIAAGVGIIAVVGTVLAYLAFWRRTPWEETGEALAAPDDSTSPEATTVDPEATSPAYAGLTAAEASLTTGGGEHTVA